MHLFYPLTSRIPATSGLHPPLTTMKNLFPKPFLLLAAAAILASPACQRKERVLDVETPGGSLKVDKDKKSGDVEIKVEEKK